MEHLTEKSNYIQMFTIFAKHSILDVWQCSEYASGSLQLFCHGYVGTLIYAKLIIAFPPNLEFSPQSEVIDGTTTFTLTIQFYVFVLSFIFFIPMSQKISVINRSGACLFTATLWAVAVNMGKLKFVYEKCICEKKEKLME